MLASRNVVSSVSSLGNVRHRQFERHVSRESRTSRSASYSSPGLPIGRRIVLGSIVDKMDRGDELLETRRPGHSTAATGPDSLKNQAAAGDSESFAASAEPDAWTTIAAEMPSTGSGSSTGGGSGCLSLIAW